MFFNNLNEEVDKFAKENGYNGAKYVGKWKEYKVYEPYMNEKKVSYIGLPLVILVNNKNEIRMSTSDEAMATLDDKLFIESFEENKNNEELNFSNRHEATAAYMEKFGGFPFMAFKGLPDTFVIEKVKTALKNNKEIPIYYSDDDRGEFIEIDKIANKITEQDAKKFIDYIDDKIAELEVDKSKIDEEIEKNLDEISKYSILNKHLMS